MEEGIRSAKRIIDLMRHHANEFFVCRFLCLAQLFSQLLYYIECPRMALIQKMIGIKAHLEKNKHDQTAKRGLLLTTSKLRRLVKYYQRSGRLAADWTLDPEKLKMYLE